MPILFVIFIAVLVILLKVFKPKILGYIGELAFKGMVDKYLGNEYKYFHNVTLKVNGDTTQIDNIIISPYGVFVVEVKNYTGWIFGSNFKSEWTQQIYKKKFKFQNPIHQNYKHIKFLECILDENIHTDIHSVVVFISKECEFKTKMPENVFKREGWVEYVKSFNTVVLNDDQIKLVISGIRNGAMEQGIKTNYQHVQNVKKIIKNKNT